MKLVHFTGQKNARQGKQGSVSYEDPDCALIPEEKSTVYNVTCVVGDKWTQNKPEINRSIYNCEQNHEPKKPHFVLLKRFDIFKVIQNFLKFFIFLAINDQ